MLNVNIEAWLVKCKGCCSNLTYLSQILSSKSSIFVAGTGFNEGVFKDFYFVEKYTWYFKLSCAFKNIIYKKQPKLWYTNSAVLNVSHVTFLFINSIWQNVYIFCNKYYHVSWQILLKVNKISTLFLTLFYIKYQHVSQ